MFKKKDYLTKNKKAIKICNKYLLQISIYIH